MSVWNEFFSAMQKMDFGSIANLFDQDATYDDYNQNGMFHHEAHLIGQEAVNMFFANRLIFQIYSFVEAQSVSENEAEALWKIDGRDVRVKLAIKDRTPAGKISAMAVTPAA